MLRVRSTLGFAAIVLALGLMPGCHPSAEEGKIRLQLNWFPDAQFGGYYAALRHGEYAAEGLDVEIVPGGPGVSAIYALTSGRVAFGVGNADQVLLARQQGGPLVAVMASLQQSPRCIMVHESSGIERLTDLHDVTLAVEQGAAFAQFLKARAPLTNVRIVSYAGSIAKFLVDPNYAQQGYVFSEPIVARRQGSDPRALMLSEIGFNPYTGLVITTDHYLASHPDVVDKFVAATCRGWRHYLSDPTPTNAEMSRLHPDMDVESLKEAVRVIRDLALPNGLTPQRLGTMDGQRWQELAEQLRGLGLLQLKEAEVDQAFRLPAGSDEGRISTTSVPYDVDFTLGPVRNLTDARGGHVRLFKGSQ